MGGWAVRVPDLLGLPSWRSSWWPTWMRPTARRRAPARTRQTAASSGTWSVLLSPGIGPSVTAGGPGM